MREATDKLHELLEEGLKMYEERVEKIEGDAIVNVKKVQDDLNLAVKHMLDDLEHARQVSKDQISSLIKEYKGNTAICEEQLLEYSRSLTKKNTLQSDKGPNFPDPPVMGRGEGGSQGSSSWLNSSPQSKAKGAPPKINRFQNPSVGGAVSQ
eukprot:5201748-Karenia_brevis.AAC.1